MVELSEEAVKERYLKLFGPVGEVGPLVGLNRFRKGASERFAALKFPSQKDEDWNYTDLGPVLQKEFRAASKPAQNELGLEELEPFLYSKASAVRLVFVNGFYCEALSDLVAAGGNLTIGSFSDQDRLKRAAIENHFGRYADYEKNIFTALNTALVGDGAFVSVSEGAVIGAPVHLIFASSAKLMDATIQPRILMVFGEGSQSTVIESFVSFGEGSNFTNAVCEMAVGANAVVDHYELVKNNPSTFHIRTSDIRLGHDSSLVSCSLALGGRLVRNSLNVEMTGKHSRCILNGFNFVSDGELADSRTFVSHKETHGTSRQLYKSIVAGKGTSVFGGKVLVHPGAVKTDAEQTNQNLLLSENGTLNTKPQLEIFADDVKCSHGAAVGRLDEGEIFYLNSRGIGTSAARKILSYGFANEVIDQIKVDDLRQQVEALLLNQLGRDLK